MGKYAWTWRIKDEYLEEYNQYHLNPWPEIMQAHSAAGIKNYSIFRKGAEFIYVLECSESAEEAFEKMKDNEAVQRWNEIMDKMIEGGIKAKKEFLREVFFLE